MVTREKGQSTMEFLVILLALTLLGLIVGYVANPGPNGVIAGAQNGASDTIAQD